MHDADPIHVVAAVIFETPDAGSRVLMACRPEGKAYAGYWEFPGGKVETGETEQTALVRELNEELGIFPQQMTPWFCRRHDYPHARVFIRFFRVGRWLGALHAREHSALHWMDPAGSNGIQPLLPANEPVLKALRLPAVYALTAAEQYGIEAELTAIEQALQRGMRLFQIYDKKLPRAQRADFAARVRKLTHRYGALLLVNDDCALAKQIQADGVHFSTNRLLQYDERPDFEWVGASCHNDHELRAAERLGVDFAVLGAVLPTPSHPGSSGIGWPCFAVLAGNAQIPLYAIGGQTPASVATALQYGSLGVAMLRGWRL